MYVYQPLHDTITSLEEQKSNYIEGYCNGDNSEMNCVLCLVKTHFM